MYITFIESTFNEYPFNGTFLSPDLDSARKYAIEMMEDIRDTTTNERQKRFAGFIINKLNTEQNISCGYGIGLDHIAVDCMTKETYDEQVADTKEALEARINSQKKKLEEMKKQYELLNNGLK